MKIIELTNKILLPVTNEESDLLDKFSDSDSLEKLSFTEREQVIASTLVNKGLLERTRINGQVNYRKSRNN